VLDSLRQPIETGEAVVARANAHVRYPARFQLVAAMNPCRCGYLSDPALGCGRAPKCAGDYQSRISGPLFDRIDMHVEVAGVSASDLALPPAAEGSEAVAARVAGARATAGAGCDWLWVGICGAGAFAVKTPAIAAMTRVRSCRDPVVRRGLLVPSYATACFKRASEGRTCPT